MIELHRRTISTAVMALALASAVAGCSDDEGSLAPGVDPAVVGTWFASSFTVGGGTNLIPPLGVSFAFFANGIYELEFSGDQGDFCDPGEVNCGETGDYTSTSTTITLDPGDTDETILSYSISGSTMTINATIEGETVVVILDKA